MIQRISIKNYQAHQDTELQLHPGINVLTGISTSGKSSIIRAIRWVHSNTPRGTSFISYWNRDDRGGPINSTSVSLLSDEGEVVRIKSPTRNGYDVCGESLNAIGSEVPEKVSRKLNLSDISFQSQHSPHFLLSQSSGEVSTFLNTVLNLSVIDETLSKVNTAARASKQKEEMIKEELAKILEQLDSLGYVDNLLPLVDEYTSYSVEYTKKQGETDKLRNVIMQCDNLLSTQKHLQIRVDKVAPLFATLESKRSNYNDQYSKVVALAQFIKQVAGCGLTVNNLSHLLKVKLFVTEQTANLAALSEKKKMIESLSNTMYTIKTCRERIATTDDNIVAIKTKMPETCLTCGGML